MRRFRVQILGGGTVPKSIDDMTYDERLARLESIVEKIYMTLEKHTVSELRIVRGELKRMRIEEVKRRSKPRRSVAQNSNR